MKKFITQARQIFPAAQRPQTRGVRRFGYTAVLEWALLTLVLLSASGITKGQQTDPLTITPDGKVGIGTTAPANKLSVGGNADFTGNLGVGTTTPATKLHIIGSGNALPANSGAVQSAGHVARLKDSSNLILDIGGNGGTGFWFQSTDLLNLATNYPLLLNPNGGNVGIGTTSPQRTLTVGKATGGGNYAQDAVSGWRDGYLLFRAGTQRASIGMDDSGTKLQLFTGSNSSDSTARLTVDSSGNVGIGTNNPTRGKVEIIGSVFTGFGGLGYLTSFAVPTDVYNPTVRNGTVQVPVGLLASDSGPISLYADNVIAAAGFWAFSDARIKRLGGRSDMARDLAKLMNIEVTDYTYVDSVSNGTGTQKKVVGQQVERVFPQAVSKGTDVVPDIYQKATSKDGWIMLATDLKKGERVRLISEKQEGIHEVLEVAEGRFRTALAADGPVFVYGREVNDARRVDYEAISMLNVSATQQIKKEKDAEVKALQGENAALRSQLAEQEKRLAAIESLLLSREAIVTRKQSMKKMQ